MIKKTFSIIIICVFLFICNVFGHKGRTDSKGGHWDKSTNKYHYHYHYHKNGKVVVDKSKNKKSTKKVTKKRSSKKTKKTMIFCEALIEEKGTMFIRIKNQDVNHNIEKLYNEIRSFLK